MSSASNDVTSRCNLEVPHAMSRLHRNFSDGSLEEEETHDFDMNVQNLSDRCATHACHGNTIFSKTPLKLFRECLVECFDIRF